MIQQVNEAQNTGEGAEKINDNEQRQDNRQNNNRKKQKEKEAHEDETQASIFHDPSLGKKIDISL
jgi:hypothetical protein